MPEQLPRDMVDVLRSDTMPSSEAEEREAELRLATQLVTAFIKAAKSSRYYPPENPLVRQFYEDLNALFKLFLDEHFFLTLEISETEFALKGHVIYTDTDLLASLPFQLYNDGLRELRFVQGIEEWEVLELLALITSHDVNDSSGNDIVTRLWEKEFAHIDYLAIDDLMGNLPALVPTNIDQFRHRLAFTPLAHREETEWWWTDSSTQADLTPIASTTEMTDPLSDKHPFLLTMAEEAHLQREVADETGEAALFLVVPLLFNILRLENERQPYQNATTALERVHDAMVMAGDFVRAADLLRHVHGLLEQRSLDAWKALALQQVIVDVGNEQRMTRIARILKQENRELPAELQNYLMLLDPRAIPLLVSILSEVKNTSVRWMICDALVVLGKDEIEVLVPYLDDERWFLVRNIIYVLGKIGQPRAVAYLTRTFQRKDPRIRREVVQAIGMIGGTSAITFLDQALTDADGVIRCIAATNLGKIGTESALDALLTVIRPGALDRKDQAEARAFLDAVGLVGSNSALPALERLLNRNPWFRRERLSAIYEGAANALRMIGTPEALALLHAGASARNESTRAACLLALRGVKRD